jgi:hypothetical protein
VRADADTGMRPPVDLAVIDLAVVRKHTDRKRVMVPGRAVRIKVSNLMALESNTGDPGVIVGELKEPGDAGGNVE